MTDKVGESRAYWSLCNAHSAMGQPEEAFHFAQKHLEISKETGDKIGQVGLFPIVISSQMDYGEYI